MANHHLSPPLGENIFGFFFSRHCGHANPSKGFLSYLANEWDCQTSVRYRGVLVVTFLDSTGMSMALCNWIITPYISRL